MNNLTLMIALATLLVLSACGKPETPVRTPALSEEAPRGPKISPLNAESAKAAGIGVAEVGPASISVVLPLYGVIQVNAEQIRQVAARFPGVVRAVQKTAGDSVKPGTVLATVESNDSLQRYAVTAPIAGVITSRAVNPGETVADNVLFVIADLSTVWVEVSLFPRDLPLVNVGQQVRLKSSDGGLTDSGRIAWVSPLGASANQSVAARILVDNTGHQWTPGLYVSAEVVLSQTDAPLTVKATAVQTLDGQTTVFVQTGRGFEARPVALGRTDGEVAEVLDGLSAGERYASVNSFIIKADIEKSDAEADEETAP